MLGLVRKSTVIRNFKSASNHPFPEFPSYWQLPVIELRWRLHTTPSAYWCSGEGVASAERYWRWKLPAQCTTTVCLLLQQLVARPVVGVQQLGGSHRGRCNNATRLIVERRQIDRVAEGAGELWFTFNFLPRWTSGERDAARVERKL